jgi:type I restriction enzyme S subunit
MSSDWLSTTVEEIAANEPSAISIGPFGSRMKSECYVDSGVPVVMGSNISDGKHPAGDFVFVTEAKAAELKSSEVREGDLVFPHRGAIGRVALIPPNTRMILSSSLMKLTPNQEKCCSDFLLYFFRSNRGVHELLKNASTVGTPGIGQPLSSLKRIPLEVPPLGEQKAIAHILGTLDDKIKLNRKTNETLEAMAKALFKSWFVDFDPVRAKVEGRPTGLPTEISDLFPDSFEDSELGEIPSGWEVKALDDVAHFLNGLALQKFPSQAGEPTLPVIKIAQLKKGDTSGADRCSTAVPDEYVIRDGDVLFSWSGSLAVDIWCGGEGALNQHLFKVTSKTYQKWFVYQWVKHHLPEFQVIAQGKATTMGHIQRHHLSEANALVPKTSLLSAMDSAFTPLLERAFGLRRQSRELSLIRDALLPKLISGEIRIPDAERMLEEVGV